MLTIWIACIVGTLGTGLGAALTFLVGGKNSSLPAVLMGISGGIMLAVVFFDILPEAILCTDTVTAVCGVALGALFVMLLSMFLPKRGEDLPGLQDLFTKSRISSLKRTGILLCTGIAIHNFPEGIAIGSGMSMPGTFGWELALLIFLHDIPEGMAMSLPLKLAGVRAWKILLLGFMVGSPTALGAWMGAFLGSLSRMVTGGCLGFAGGAMLYLTLKELIPESVRLKNALTTFLSCAAGIAAGAALVFMI